MRPMNTQILQVNCALLSLAMSTSALAQVRTADEPQDDLPPPDLEQAVAASPEPARERTRGDGRLGFYFSLGGLFISPTGRSGEVELANVGAQARLSGMTNGPIAGSYTRMGSNLMAAAIIGYAPPILNRQLSIETILALPFAQKLYAGGTLANNSLGPKALNSLPTGVPALGEELGEVKALPPVVTAVYRFFPDSIVHPYLGFGACLMIVMEAKITNPVLSEVSAPKVDIPPKVGWVGQAGVEVRLFGSFFVTADLKYIGGLDITSTVKDIWVRLPELPIYGRVKVGDNVARMSVNPVLAQFGIGMAL
jgi:outer membrane protein W